MKQLFCFLMIFVVVFAGCTSTPKVDRFQQLEKGEVNKYDVVIDSDYVNDPAEFQYAVNEFVKGRGGQSYDIEKTGSNDYLITIPGETMVIDDLPKARHFHAGRTVAAIVIPVGLSAIILTTILILDNTVYAAQR